ncbi:sorting nexin, putative [Ixodes scapularis]|uniref:Sorting nexin, putative n=1 Tax=Ixodes scapularis TaxID=6945 RepID=B7PDH8_IXOSC|nr:sorting nexin, putative [Ixodes scapularis]|eukprot:XP_002410812.1 sorting nexin, putative [Ixodes scapularis]
MFPLVLIQVLNYVLRDYVYTWYLGLSTDEAFTDHIRDLVHQVIINFSSRANGVDWVQYLTIQLVDDFASHLRLFRQAQTKLKLKKNNDGNAKAPDLLSLFFNLETTMEQKLLCRDLVCISKEREMEYLQHLGEVLLYLLLPPDDFHNKVMRVFLRELLVNTVLLPVINLVSDPDYINQTIVWMCRNNMPTSDDFLTVLRCTDNLNELEAVQEIVAQEIAVQRSRDSGGDDDTVIKKQLNSLLYLKKVVENRLQRLNDGSLDTDSTGLPSLFQLPFDVVLANNIALSYFIDFMTSIGAQKYISFYLHAEGYKVAAEQLLSEAHSTEDRTTNLESLREAAGNIYDMYISEKASGASSRINVDDAMAKKLLRKLRVETPDEFWFDDIQQQVAQIMQEKQHFPSFMKSPAYIKLLADLDLLKDFGSKSDEEGKKPFSFLFFPIEFLNKDLPTVPPEPIENVKASEAFLTANIYNTASMLFFFCSGIVREGSTSFALYAISVCRREPLTPEERWCVFRRYSDFDDFHILILEKFPKLSKLPFPGKKTFNNLSRQFLEQRRSQLNEFLQRILHVDVLSVNRGLREMMLHFLEPGLYEKEKKQFARTVGSLVNPLKSSVRSMGNMVKNAPENLFDGLRDGIIKVLRSRPNASPVDAFLEGSGKVGAGIDIESFHVSALQTQDNIPLRIMLLLMDEVFDLKSKNQWLRRRIVVILRQIIKATFGDTINRKIVDYVEWMASSEKIAEYITALKDALWPNGYPAETQPERDLNTMMRTRVAAKTIMLCSLTDELKHIIGSDTTRRGMLCVFEMFQHEELNRRLTYVLLEGFLATLFPSNRFHELFRTMHAKSPTISTASASSNNSGKEPPSFSGRRPEVR